MESVDQSRADQAVAIAKEVCKKLARTPGADTAAAAATPPK